MQETGRKDRIIPGDGDLVQEITGKLRQKLTNPKTAEKNNGKPKDQTLR